MTLSPIERAWLAYADSLLPMERNALNAAMAAVERDLIDVLGERNRPKAYNSGPALKAAIVRFMASAGYIDIPELPLFKKDLP